MTIQRRIVLNDEEQNLITQVDDLITQVYNELDSSDKEGLKKIMALTNALADFAYDYGSDDYRDGCL